MFFGRNGYKLLGIGRQLSSHVLIIFVGQHAHYKDQFFVRQILAQTVDQFLSPIGIMGAIQQKERVTVEHFKPAGPNHIFQAGIDGVFRNGNPSVDEGVHGVQYHCGIVVLIGAQQGKHHLFSLPLGKALAFQIGPDQLLSRRIGDAGGDAAYAASAKHNVLRRLLLMI